MTEDTQVFQEGELGKNPMSGGNLSTYKELCGLATDMGQPDLVYKFMHLANYNATWNSRKGGSFAFYLSRWIFFSRNTRIRINGWGYVLFVLSILQLYLLYKGWV